MSQTLLLTVLILVCSNVFAQEPENQSKADGRVVLVLSVLESEVTHSHLGVTAFTNYEKKLDNDWKVPATTEKLAAEIFSENGYRVVVLAVPEERAEVIRNRKFMKTGWSKFKLEQDFAGWLWTEMDKVGAAYALILQSYAMPYSFDAPVTYSGYGLMSLYGKQPKEAYLYANVSSYLVTRGRLDLPLKSTPGGDCRIPIDPVDIKIDNYENLTAGDLAPFRGKIEGLIEKRIRDYLTFEKLIPGTFEKCRM